MALGLAGDVYVSVAVGCIQELHLSLQFVLSALQLLPLQDLSSLLRVRQPYDGPTYKLIIA